MSLETIEVVAALLVAAFITNVIFRKRRGGKATAGASHREFINSHNISESDVRMAVTVYDDANEEGFAVACHLNMKDTEMVTAGPEVLRAIADMIEREAGKKDAPYLH